jgi:hypothetical protein
MLELDFLAVMIEHGVQVCESQFPEALPLPMPEGITALGSVELIRETLDKAGLQNMNVGKVRHCHSTDCIPCNANVYSLNSRLDIGPKQYCLCAESMSSARRSSKGQGPRYHSVQSYDAY